MPFIKRVLRYIFYERLCGYSERPLRVLISSLVLIFGSTLFYLIFGNIYKGKEQIGDFGSLLYFSTVTFTTLGYGDYHPESWIRYIASFEALSGAFMISLFIVVLTRKFLR